MRKTGEGFAHYTIESLLGRGGMGEVYRAFDTKLHRRVALKLLLTSEGSSSGAQREATARIVREARAAAALEHPNKVSIFELGEVDGTPYLAMEYIAGVTLREIVGDPSIAWTRKLGWLLDVARALEAAHAAGLVHRDIKPENVMVREDGIVKVLDFGIARRADSAVDESAPTVAPSIEALTGKGVVIGTVAYMPPEQMHGGELDGRADQFSWGVMAFELLSGRHPWGAVDETVVMIGAMLTKPAQRLDGVPEIVADTIARTLHAERGQRFSSMAEIVAALAPVVGQSGPIVAILPIKNASSLASPARAEDPANTADAVTAANVTTDAAMARTEIADSRAMARSMTTAPAARASVGRAKRVGAALGLMAILAGALGIWRWSVVRTRVEYCIDWEMSSFGPRCLGPQPAETIGHRSHTHKLTSGRYGVETIERLNSAGLAIRYGGYTAVEIRRGPDGAVQDVVVRSQDGVERLHEVWSNGGAQVDSVDADGKTPRHWQDSRTTTLRRTYDAHGFVSRELYVGPTGKPRASETGVFGKEFEHEPDGFLRRETFLSWDEKPMSDRRGVATVTHTTDARGAQVESRYVDLAGNPTPVDGVATLRHEYTTDLDFAGDTFLDASGAKVANLSYGTHGFRVTRDTSQRTVRTTFLDENGTPRQRKGDSYASEEDQLDERGREIKNTYLDVGGNPVVTAENGAAIWRFVWDERDHPVERHPLDPAGRPMPCRWAYTSRTDVIDARGRRAEEHHFDGDGKPAPADHNTAIVKISYDERDLRTEIAFFGANGAPATGADGDAGARYKYDRLRNDIEFVAFDIHGKPTLTQEGYSIQRRRFDDDDNLVETSTFDPFGAPMSTDGFAKKVFQHDRNGWVIEESYFDTNDNPVLNKEGVAVVRYVRDRSGDVTEESYLGKHGEAMEGAGGYAKKKNTYELHRRRVETALLDATGAAVLGKGGWSIERISYDERGLVVRESHFDRAGQAVMATSGSASVARDYDGRGNLVEERTLGIHDEPVATSAGYARKKSTYDPRDLLIEEALFGPDGAPTLGKKGWSVRKLRYDELGNLVDESFFDVERKPTVAKDPAYARKRDKYNARRRLTETSYFDASGVPAKGPEGAETIRYVPDAYGRPTETAYFDAASAPAVSKDGKQVVRSSYDDAGRLIEELFVDASGNARASKRGCSGQRTRYDERGQKIEERCLDDKGGLALSSDGWAVKRLVYDARGLMVDEATYGVDEKLRADAVGISRRKHRYDERGLLLETTFWTADDKPAKDNRGVVALRYRYDDASRLLDETAIDAKGAVVVTKPAPGKD